MNIIARESFNDYGENKIMLFAGEIADLPDDQANRLIADGKAYKYDLENGTDESYVPVAPTPGTDDEMYLFVMGNQYQYAPALIKNGDTVPVDSSETYFEGSAYVSSSKDLKEMLTAQTYPVTIKNVTGCAEVYDNSQSYGSQFIYKEKWRPIDDFSSDDVRGSITFVVDDKHSFTFNYEDTYLKMHLTNYVDVQCIISGTYYENNFPCSFGPDVYFTGIDDNALQIDSVYVDDSSIIECEITDYVYYEQTYPNSALSVTVKSLGYTWITVTCGDLSAKFPVTITDASFGD